MARRFKLRRQAPDERDHVCALYRDVKFPSKVLLTGMPEALDQGELGSCASNAASNCLRYLLRKEHAQEFQPSRLYLYWNARVNVEHESPDEDTGVTLRGLCKSIARYHACNERVWPYIIANFSTAPPLLAYRNAGLHARMQYVAVPQEMGAIRARLAAGFPILFGMEVFDSFTADETIRSGVVPMPDTGRETSQGGHAVLMCGYDDDSGTITFQNSWGPDVGQHGFFQIPYDYVLNPELAFDLWAITSFY